MVYLTAILPCTFRLFPVFSRNSVAIHMSMYAECADVLGYLLHRGTCTWDCLLEGQCQPVVQAAALGVIKGHADNSTWP